jgi:hypothetical protein
MINRVGRFCVGTTKYIPKSRVFQSVPLFQVFHGWNGGTVGTVEVFNGVQVFKVFNRLNS